MSHIQVDLSSKLIAQTQIQDSFKVKKTVSFDVG